MSFNFKVGEIKSKKEWERFVLSGYPNTFLQSWNWGEFHRLMGRKIFRLGVFKGESLLGVALTVKEKARRGTYLACPGGPLIDFKNQRLFGFLAKYLGGLGKKEGARFIRVRPSIFRSPENLATFRRLGFRDAPTHMHAETTWEFDLSSSEEELLARMRKHTRYDIRRAVREGVTVVQSRRPESVKVLYRLQAKAAKRRRFTPFSERYLKMELEAFRNGDRGRIFLAKLGGRVLSAALIVFYGDTAFYHHGASAESSPRISSSHLLLWEAIKEAKKRGCKNFNFWGIAPTDDPGHPWAGLSFFKKGFGGRRVDYLHAQDLPLTTLYWLTYVFELARRLKRGL